MLPGLLLAADMAEAAARIHRARAEHLRIVCRPGDETAQAAADALAGFASSLRLRADAEDTGEYETIELEPEGPPPLPRLPWWRRLLRNLST
jgi:hypothetical protein